MNIDEQIKYIKEKLKMNLTASTLAKQRKGESNDITRSN